MFSRISTQSPKQTAPSGSSVTEQVIKESIKIFHAILQNDDKLLNAFWTRGSLEEDGHIFPVEGDETTMEKVRCALEAIDRGDTTTFCRHDETRESVIVGAVEFARFREHMKTSEALIYEAAAFTSVTICVYEKEPSADSLEMDPEDLVRAQKELQEKILQALQIEILRLEYEKHTSETRLLIDDPAIPASMTVRVAELIQEDWDIKKTKSIVALHNEMILIKKEFDNIHQMMEASQIAYEEAKEGLIARLKDDYCLTPEIAQLGKAGIKTANECEERQIKSLAYQGLRTMLLECMDAMDKQKQKHIEYLDFASMQLLKTLNEPGISEASIKKINETDRQFQDDRKTKSLGELVENAKKLLDFKSGIQRQINQDKQAYKKLIELSSTILDCYDIPEEFAQPLRDEISKSDTRAESEKLEALQLVFNAANDAKTVRQMEIKTTHKTHGRYAVGLPPTDSLNDRVSLNHSTQNQYKNKQLLLGIGLILLGVAVLSITIMTAIATFGASAPLAALALPLSLSLAASGVSILGMTGLGLAATGGYALSK